MGLEDDLGDQLSDALRSGDTVRRDTIRQLRAALHNEVIAVGHALDASEETVVVRRLVNQHKESITEFTRGGRNDLVVKEEAELEILKGLLPEEISREEITDAARTAIGAVGAQGRQDLGKVMRELSVQLKGRADMRTVNEIVQSMLP